MPCASRSARVQVMRAALLLALAVVGCATVDPPLAPPLPSVQYIPYAVDRPVPCFAENERPTLRPLTAIDMLTATIDQKSAALAADMENERLFTAEVDRLFVICSKRIADGTATQPVGGRP